MTVLFDFLSVPANATRLATLVVLTLFLPLSALTYQLFRRHRKNAKIERMFDLLSVHEKEQQRHLQPRPGSYLCITATYATIVSVLGLTILLFGEQIGLDQSNATDFGRSPVEQAEVTDPARFPVERSEVTGSDQFPMKRSWLMFGMGFLGGYLWGIQYVFRRYVDDDLTPGVYHALAIRMMLAGTVAAVTYNAYAALASEPLIGGTKAWPALAFVLGMFPQRGISWIRDRIPFLSEDDDPSVRKAPLEMIEGITFHDRVRLQEESIDNCYDLATADFVPLVINTSYSARQLTDWILQAKLCVYAPDAMLNLRQQGIRTIMDLEDLEEEERRELVEATAMTKSALERALKPLKTDDEIERLRHVGKTLGKFTEIEEPPRDSGNGSPTPERA